MCKATIYEARNNFSSLVKLAESGEPVELTRHDKPVAVTISYDEYEKSKPKESFFTWLEKFKKEYIKKCINDAKESYEIIPYDSFAAQICGELRTKCEKQGKTASLCNSQIAVTAIANGMVLITHNTEDFKVFQENSFLKIEDWWD